MKASLHTCVGVGIRLNALIASNSIKKESPPYKKKKRAQRVLTGRTLLKKGSARREAVLFRASRRGEMTKVYG